MARPRTLLLSSLLGAGSLLACNGSDPGGGGDGGSSPDAGALPDASAECTTVDTTCPEQIPAQAAACASGLSCDYTDGEEQWRYDCTDGLWVATNVFCSHDGICIPPLVQRCTDPFAGTLTGVTVEVDPWAGELRPFDSGEIVPLVWGPQGASMVPFRLRLVGDGAPACVTSTITATTDGTAGPSVPMPIAVHCGISQPLLFILPIDCGGTAEHTVDLSLEVAGIGAASASVVVTGGDHPCTL